MHLTGTNLNSLFERFFEFLQLPTRVCSRDACITAYTYVSTIFSNSKPTSQIILFYRLKGNGVMYENVFKLLVLTLLVGVCYGLYILDFHLAVLCVIALLLVNIDDICRSKERE